MSRTISEQIRTSRESVGVSQRALVKAVNRRFGTRTQTALSNGHLADIETGRRNPSNHKLYMITSVLENLGAN